MESYDQHDSGHTGRDSLGQAAPRGESADTRMFGGERLIDRVRALHEELRATLSGPLAVLQKADVTGDTRQLIEYYQAYWAQLAADIDSNEIPAVHSTASQLLADMGRMGPVTRVLPEALSIDHKVRRIAQDMVDALSEAHVPAKLVSGYEDGIEDKASTIQGWGQVPDLVDLDGGLIVGRRSFWVDLADPGVQAQYPRVSEDERLMQCFGEYLRIVDAWVSAADLTSLRSGADYIDKTLLPLLEEMQRERPEIETAVVALWVDLAQLSKAATKWLAPTGH